MAAAGDADLVFVGRSPESLYDYLRGACFDTSWHDRLHLLLVSLDTRWPAVRRIVALQNYLATVGLDPRDTASAASGRSHWSTSSGKGGRSGRWCG